MLADKALPKLTFADKVSASRTYLPITLLYESNPKENCFVTLKLPPKETPKGR